MACQVHGMAVGREVLMKSNERYATCQIVLVAAQGERGASDSRYRPDILRRIALGCVRPLAIAAFLTVVVGGFPAIA